MASSHRDEISRLELLHAAHPDGLVFPHLADAYRRAGRYAQAESILDSGLRHHANYSSAHVVLGRLRLDQGKSAEAESAFQRVLQIDPQNQIALEYLADLCYQQGRLEESLGHYRRLTRLKTDDEIADRVAELESRLDPARDAATVAPAARSAGSPGDGPPAGGVDAGEEPSRSTSTYAASRPNGSRTDRGSNGGGSGREPVHAPDRGVAGPPERTASPRLVPEPGEVVTETMAELYARQGLMDRAAAVYRELLRSRPGDTRLRAKLESLEARAIEAPPEVASAAAPAESTIRGQLRQVLSWSPNGSPPAEAPRPEPQAAAPPEPPSAAAEPWADAAVSEPEPRPAPEAAAEREPDSAPEATSASVSERIPGAGPEPAAETPEAPAPPPAPPPPAPQPAEPAEPVEPVAGPAESAPTGWATVTESERFRASLSSTGTAAFDGASAQTRALIALTDLLVGLLEYRDPFFRGSSSLTRLLATSVAQELGVSQEEQVDLALAAVLRDLGRLALGGRLLPGGASQTSEARARIERHVDLALHLMEGIDLPENVRLAVRHHHERWDGAGYPDGLSGKGIPFLARILAVVDSFAAMVSPRPYRLPRKVPDAARELEEEAGTRYDPTVVAALLRVLERRRQRQLGFVQRHHILIVNPDQPGATITAAKLCSAGYLAEVSVDVGTARERLRRVPVAALVVSAEEGVDAAGAFIREIRRDPMFSALPVVVTEADSVDLRVRLLEEGADVCFPPGISYAELQGTLGAMVRRNDRARPAEGAGDGTGDSPWLALQGDIRDFPLTWLLQVMKYDSRTAAVAIRDEAHQGVIYLRQGDAIHAQVRGGATGERALLEMLKWRSGRFTVRPDERPEETTISTSIMHLLLTQAVDEDHQAAGVFGAVSAE